MTSLLHINIFTIFFCLFSINSLKIHSHFQTRNVTYTDLKTSINQHIDYKYYDNLNSRIANYYYGSITKQSYQMRIKLYKMDDYEMCGSATPYATLDMQSCKVCPSDKPLFNLGSRQCQKCREHVTQKCDKLLNVNVVKNTTNMTGLENNITTINNTNTNINNTSTVNIANTNQTTNNNNIASNTTIASGNTTKPNTTTSTSTGQTTATTSSPHVVTWHPKKNITNTTTTATTASNTSIQLLPVGENGKPISQQNILTPLSQYRVVQNTTLSNISTNSQNLIASTNRLNITFANQQCPINTPLYNIITKSCESCKQNQQYVPLKKKCLPIIYISNGKYKNVILKSTNQLLVVNNKIKMDNLDRVVRECSIEKPIVVNNTCISCADKEIFNFTKQQCQAGCPQGQILSQLNSNCINATFITNPDAENLLSPINDFEVFRSEQKNKETSSSAIVYCPIDRPFTIDGKCSQCPSQNPLFNIEGQRCQNCSRNRKYDSFQRKCVSGFEPGLQVVKMVPNIF